MAVASLVWGWKCDWVWGLKCESSLIGGVGWCSDSLIAAHAYGFDMAEVAQMASVLYTAGDR